ncbi:MAG: hypothetical protein GY854_10595 [Deltaproteobacteria bacterium]|nr:hypothetical protein [Deltaproteobacteria bacterium]
MTELRGFEMSLDVGFVKLFQGSRSGWRPTGTGAWRTIGGSVVLTAGRNCIVMKSAGDPGIGSMT